MNKYDVRRLPLSVAVSSVLVTGAAQAAVITVDSSADAPLGTYASDCTLRAAIASANTDTAVDGCVAGTAGLDEIEFDQSLASSTITTSDAQFEITSPVSITGPVEGDSTGLTISGGGLYRTLWIEGNAPGSIEVSLDSLTVRDGYLGLLSPDFFGGAGINSRNADLSLTDVQVTSNYSYYGRNGLYLSNGALSIERATINNNFDGYLGGTGGGVTTLNAEVVITDSQIQNNKTAYGAGGLLLNESISVISGSVISSNSADDYFGFGNGGGIKVSGGELTLIDSEIRDNDISSAGSGGGIHSRRTDVTLVNTEVESNSIGYYFGFTQRGAGIYADEGSLTLTDSSVSNNSIDSYFLAGGGIFADSLALDIQRTRVSGNQLNSYQSAYGSGLYLSNVSGTIAYSDVSLNDVYGDYANGAGIVLASGDLELVNTTVSGNTITSYNPGNIGAASGILLSSTSSLTLTHSTVANNRPDGGELTRTIQVGPQAGFTLINSLISGPTDLDLCSTQASSATLSLAVDTSCTGTATDPTDLALGSLNDNGGPTRTHSLGTGSVAIDAAGDCDTDHGVALDQRGLVRVLPCDIGAFEFFDGVFADRFED